MKGGGGSLVGVASGGGGLGGYGVGGALRDGRIEEADEGKKDGRSLFGYMVSVRVMLVRK